MVYIVQESRGCNDNVLGLFMSKYRAIYFASETEYLREIKCDVYYMEVNQMGDTRDYTINTIDRIPLNMMSISVQKIVSDMHLKRNQEYYSTPITSDTTNKLDSINSEYLAMMMNRTEF